MHAVISDMPAEPDHLLFILKICQTRFPLLSVLAKKEMSIVWSQLLIADSKFDVLIYLNCTQSSIVIYWAHSPFVSKAFFFAFSSYLCVYQSSFLFLCHWISFVFFFTTEVSAPSFARPSPPHRRTNSGIHLTCGPAEGDQECAQSRNLHPKCCPGRGLNLGPLTWQSSTKPLDHCAQVTLF